jgi:putative ABC transport system permease protein
MNLVENIREGLRSVQSNLLRTIITALIVTLGITSLVGILTAVDSMKYSIDQTFSNLGANSFDIRRKGYNNRSQQSGRTEKVYPPVSYQEARWFKSLQEGAARVSISTFVSGNTVVKSKVAQSNPNVGVVGGDENFLLNENYNLKYGRGFSAFELKNGVNVAIIGTELASTLFPKQESVGEPIYFFGQRYLVIGQLEATGSTMGGGGADRRVLIPLEAAYRLPRQQALTFSIKTTVPDTRNLDFALGEATGLMRKVRQDRPGQEDSFEISRSDSLSRELDKISGGLKFGGFIIGFITLLGASIGLMNIMMVSVTERTQEIGVRKALGATIRQIRMQFLIEAIVICLIGGIAGVLLGVGIGNAVARMIGQGAFIVPWLWIGVGLAICVVVGLVSGYYPAYKASKLDPIESLRYE